MAASILALERTIPASAPVADAASAAGSPPPSAAVQRQRLALERNHAEVRYAQAVSGCEGRFISTPCLNAARADRRRALERLRLEAVALDDVERQARARERLRAIAEKSQASAPVAGDAPPLNRRARDTAPAREAAELSTAAGSAVPGSRVQPAAPSASAAPGTPSVGLRPTHPARPGGAPNAGQGELESRLRREAESRAAYEHRQAEAAAHAGEIARRKAERDAHRPASAGLPVPPAASSP